MLLNLLYSEDLVPSASKSLTDTCYNMLFNNLKQFKVITCHWDYVFLY